METLVATPIATTTTQVDQPPRHAHKDERPTNKGHGKKTWAQSQSQGQPKPPRQPKALDLKAHISPKGKVNRQPKGKGSRIDPSVPYASLDKYEKRNRIASILGVSPARNTWQISQELLDESLVLVNAYEPIDQNPDAKVDGTIIDVSLGKIVCPSLWWGLTPSDSSEGKHLLSKADSALLGVEGFVVRAWKDAKGKAHLSPSRRVDFLASQSRREDGTDLVQLYRDLGGKEPHAFFNDQYQLSSWVHTFVISATSTLTVSRQPSFLPPVLVYMGAIDTLHGKRQQDARYEPQPRHVYATKDRNEAVAKKLPWQPAPLVGANVASYLSVGGYTDQLPLVDKAISFLLPGEFVIIQESNRYRMVASPAYLWRRQVRHNMNVEYMLALLEDRIAGLPPARNGAPFTTKQFPVGSLDGLVWPAGNHTTVARYCVGKQLPPTPLQELADSTPAKPTTAMDLALLALYYTLPLHKLPDLVDAYQQRNRWADRITDAILRHHNDDDLLTKHSGPNAAETRTRMAELVKLVRELGAEGDVVLDDIDKHLSTLSTTSLYHLVRACDRIVPRIKVEPAAEEVTEEATEADAEEASVEASVPVVEDEVTTA